MILLTRPLKDSEFTAKKLAELGYECLIEPMLEITKLQPKIPQADYYIITSKNARGFAPNDKTISIPEQGKNAEEIMHYTLKNLRGKKLVYLRGNEITLEISERLKNEGFDASSVIVYNTASPTIFSDNFLKNIGKVTTALFFSQRSAEIFCRIATTFKLDLASITAICISSKVANSLSLKFKTIKTSKEPNLESMLDIIKAKA